MGISGSFALSAEPQMNLTKLLRVSLYHLIAYSHSRIIAETECLYSQKQQVVNVLLWLSQNKSDVQKDGSFSVYFLSHTSSSCNLAEYVLLHFG